MDTVPFEITFEKKAIGRCRRPFSRFRRPFADRISFIFEDYSLVDEKQLRKIAWKHFRSLVKNPSRYKIVSVSII